MKKVLLIGNGAREHVIAETLKRSSQDVELICYASARNPGIADLSSVYEIGSLSDMNAISDFASHHQPNFSLVGPENPIAAGVVNHLAEAGIPSIAPFQEAAILESSKSFTRSLLQKYGIPGNPRFRTFDSEENILEFAQELDGNFVVKADGLCGGKGVKVSGDHFTNIEEGIAFAKHCLHEDGKVVLEEKLIGQEFSLMSFVDGKTVIDMPAVQDHKRAFDSDRGPNTGGMGSYSDSDHSLPFLTDKDLADAHLISQAVAAAIFSEVGILYKGILYGGFIVTPLGVRLIEYNVRFGDPEAMNVLPLLETDFITVCEAIIEGNLDQIQFSFLRQATVCKYTVPQGYPDNPKKGARIQLGPLPHGVHRYFASIDEKDGELYLSGSRAIAFVGMAQTLAEAEKLAQMGVESVHGPVFYRKDIGTNPLIAKRVEMMKELRSLYDQGITP